MVYVFSFHLVCLTVAIILVKKYVTLASVNLAFICQRMWNFVLANRHVLLNCFSLVKHGNHVWILFRVAIISVGKDSHADLQVLICASYIQIALITVKLCEMIALWHWWNLLGFHIFQTVLAFIILLKSFIINANLSLASVAIVLPVSIIVISIAFC